MAKKDTISDIIKWDFTTKQWFLWDDAGVPDIIWVIYQCKFYTRHTMVIPDCWDSKTINPSPCDVNAVFFLVFVLHNNVYKHPNTKEIVPKILMQSFCPFALGADVWLQICGEGTVSRPVGFSLLIPPSRIHTRGKFTLTRCDANWKGRGGG